MEEKANGFHVHWPFVGLDGSLDKFVNNFDKIQRAHYVENNMFISI